VRGCDVLVVGGGVIGSAIAWSLARDGRSVVLLERDQIGAHASSVAAGMLAPLAEAEDGGALAPLGLESLGLFPSVTEALRERSGIDPHFVVSGVLRVALGDTEVEPLRARAARLAPHGAEWLDAAALRAEQPELGPEARGALWSPREAHVESDLLTRAFAAAAQALGARLECGAPALEVLRRRERAVGVRTPDRDWLADRVVIATGPWAGTSGGSLGLDAPPVRPVRGQIVVLDAPRPLFGPIVWGEPAYLVARRDGRILVGATEEAVGFDCRVTAAGVGGLLAGASRLVPALAGAGFRAARAGLRPGSPDGLPLVGPHPQLEGVLLAVGHHRNGVLLAPLTGRLVAELVAGKPAGASARALRPDRFGS
jgi:glycine oxidase